MNIIHLAPKCADKTEQPESRIMESALSLILPFPESTHSSTCCLTKDKDFTLLRMPSQGGRKVARGTAACKGEKRGLEQDSEPKLLRRSHSKSQEHLYSVSQALLRQSCPHPWPSQPTSTHQPPALSRRESRASFKTKHEDNNSGPFVCPSRKCKVNYPPPFRNQPFFLGPTAHNVPQWERKQLCHLCQGLGIWQLCLWLWPRKASSTWVPSITLPPLALRLTHLWCWLGTAGIPQ